MNPQDIKQVIKKNQNSLLKKANVVSVGCGYPVRNGKKQKTLGIIVGVSEKIPQVGLMSVDMVPQKIDGVTIDTMKVGNIQAHPKKPKKTSKVKAQAEFDPKNRHRPAIPGTSIAHKNVTAGTFGCVVKRDGKELILSNNHVLAASNEASIGDTILQPGPYDGGTSSDKIGTLYDFVTIIMKGGGGDPPSPGCSFAKAAAGFSNAIARVFGRRHRLVAYDPRATENHVDSALALPTEAIVQEIHQIGKPVGLKEATIGMAVQKYGRTTEYTTSDVVQMYTTVDVSYGPGKVARFEDQIITGPLSAGGDSGSAVLDMNNNIVGLLFAGSDSTTILNPIQAVFDKLNCTLP